ncbi:MAG: sulfurtransferase [Planctomycetes bacterium]|nr:sulfurtransferase [Planctomycetota bacterium]
MTPIAPRELARRLATPRAGERLVLLDVREPDELAICRLPGALAIPMGEVPRRLQELDRAAAIVCVCHHGIRSANVAGLLARSGFTHVLNLSGGVERWALEVDPAMARY